MWPFQRPWSRFFFRNAHLQRRFDGRDERQNLIHGALVFWLDPKLASPPSEDPKVGVHVASLHRFHINYESPKESKCFLSKCGLNIGWLCFIGIQHRGLCVLVVFVFALFFLCVFFSHLMSKTYVQQAGDAIADFQNTQWCVIMFQCKSSWLNAYNSDYARLISTTKNIEKRYVYVQFSLVFVNITDWEVC